MVSEEYSHLGQTNEGKDIQVSVVVPTYNEKENLLQYIDELKSTLGDSIDYEIIVVDDNSPDGTGKLADELSRKNNDVKVIHRPKKMGLASALVEGFKVSSGEFVLVSDADLQHSPELIKTFLEEVNRGADLVIASRYIAEAETKGWSPLRRIVSKSATAFAHIFLPKTRRINDPISGYFMLRKEMLLRNRLTGISWKLLLEILVNGGFQKVVEVPYVFRPRINGKSKLKLREFFDYLILIALLRERIGKPNFFIESIQEQVQQIRKEPKINLNQQTGAYIHTKPSVLMVSTYPPDRDGIASYTARLENVLRKENITIRIAANGRDWKRNSLSYVFSIIRKAIGSKTDIVHVQLSYFMFGNEYYTGLFPLLSLSLKLLGKRVVITLHDIVRKSNVKNDFLKNHTSPHFLSFKRWALNNYTRIVCSIADKVILHSEIAQNALTQDYAVPQRKIQVIPHGIDQVSIPAAEDLCENKSLSNKDLRIVSYFGLVRHGKGLENLVKAWKKVKNVNAQLLIIGDKHPILKDDCYDNLIKLVKELELEASIRFCGYVPDELLPAYLTESDVFVFPYSEWGDVIASSGALSVVAPYLKPIIATDVPAFDHLKNLGAAVIVEKGDIDGLASAIMEVLRDVRIRSSLIDKLRKWLPESSWSNVAKKTATLYRELV